MTTTNKSRAPRGCWRMKPLAGCLDASWDGPALRGNRHFGADPGWIGLPGCAHDHHYLGLEPAPAAPRHQQCWPVVIPPGMGENYLCHTQAPG